MAADAERMAEEIAARVAARLNVPSRDERPLLTVKDVAERLNISDRSARTLMSRLPTVVVLDGARRMEPAVLDEYIRSRASEGAGDGAGG